MTVRRTATGLCAVALAVGPVAGAQASTHRDAEPHAAVAARLAFYANGSHNRLMKVTISGGRVAAKALVAANSPVWWRTFYLTPTSTAGSWVVGSFSGDQKDTTDPPRMFAFDTATGRLRWLARRSWQYHSPVVDAEKTPVVFYVAGRTVRRISAAGVRSHRVFSAPRGWTISALTVAGTAAPDVALTRNTGPTVATARTYVVALTKTPTTVLPTTRGTVTALALSEDTKTLAISRVKPDGDSVLTLQARSPGGLVKTLPAVGETAELSWDPAGDMLAVDPEQWGGLTLVYVATGTTSYPTAMQPYGGAIFASG